MNMKKLFGIMMVVAILYLISLAIFAHDHNGDSDSDDTVDFFDGDTIIDINGNSSRALALGTGSLGAAAIEGCLATTQFSLLILFKKQGVKLDNWCVAKDMDQAGKYEDAAVLRCTYQHFSKTYGDRCTDVMNFKKPNPGGEDEGGNESESALVGLYNRAAIYDERYEQQQKQEEELESVKEQLAAVLGRLDRQQHTVRVRQQVQQQQQAQEDEVKAYFRGKYEASRGQDESE